MRKILVLLAVLVLLAGMTPNSASAEKFTGYTSQISLANTSTTIAHITIEYFNTSPVGVTSASDTINPLKSKTYFPLSTPPTGFSGSVVISSDQPLASISNLYANSQTIMTSYTGVSAGATTAYLPALMHKNGANRNDTWYVIQNVGTASTSVSVSYSDGCTAGPFTINAGYSKKVDNAVEACHDTKGAAGKIFAATLTSTVSPIAVAVLQEKGADGSLKGLAYGWTGYTTGGSLYPVFPATFFNNSNNQTGIQLMNTGSVQTTVTVSYTKTTAGTNFTETHVILPKKTVVFGWPACLSPVPPQWTSGSTTCVRGAKFLGGGRVTTNSASQMLQAIVTQPKYTTSRAGAYRAFSYTSATVNDGSPRLVMPLVMDRYGSTLLYTNTNIMNLGSTTAYIKCFMEGTPATTKTYTTGTAGLPAGGVFLVTNFNTIANNFRGSGYCQTYTSNTYTTVNSAGKIVAVVNEVTSNAANLDDTLMIYEAVNVSTTVP